MYNAGLILEGGGMRGVYTAGVLDAFLEQDVEFSSIYGVSAGSCHACSYMSKQPGRAFRVNVDYLDDPDGYRGLPFTRFYADCIGSGTPVMWEEML